MLTKGSKRISEQKGCPTPVFIGMNGKIHPDLLTGTYFFLFSIWMTLLGAMRSHVDTSSMRSAT